MRRPLTTLTAFACLALATPTLAQSARDVTYTRESVVTLHAKLRFTTLIVLPEEEEILDFVCGDKEFWVVSGVQNLAYVKPAKAGTSTNLNLVTASGRVYSFVLTEGAPDPDLKVFVRPDATVVAPMGPPRFYASHQMEELRRQVEDARRDADDARRQIEAAREIASKIADQKVNEFRARFPTQLRFPYRFKPHQRPFNVDAIFTDGTFTYIRADPTELPALYELVDAGVGVPAPNLVNFQVERGLYVVAKVLERGYLAIGRHRLVFETAR